MPQERFKCVIATSLSVVLHGCAFWAAGLMQPGPVERPKRYAPMELVSIVRSQPPEAPPLAFATQPGADAAIENDAQDEASSQVREPPQATRPEPRPEPDPPAMNARNDEPSVDAMEPSLEHPIAHPPALPALANLAPPVRSSGLLRRPQGRPSSNRASAAAGKPGLGQGSADTAKGGRTDDRNPMLLTPLDRILRRTYPNDAREAGIEGYAKLDLVVTRWGRPASIRIVTSHGHAGFGEACLRAVKRSRWRPAKDRSGRRVAMRVRYRCRFTLER